MAFPRMPPFSGIKGVASVIHGTDTHMELLYTKSTTPMIDTMARKQGKRSIIPDPDEMEVPEDTIASDFARRFNTVGRSWEDGPKVEEERKAKDASGNAKPLSEKEEAKRKATDIFTRAMTRFEQRKYKSCLILLDECLILDPDFHDALYQRGVTYFKMAKYHEARRDIQKFLLHFPEHKEARFMAKHIERVRKAKT